MPSYVNPHLTHLNREVYSDPSIVGCKSLVPLITKAEKEYQEKVGQKCQKTFTPFRESVLVIKPDTSDLQLRDFARKAEELTGWRCLGIWVHQDEGHAKSRYIEGEEGFAINHHAHILWDCQDHSTGRIVRIERNTLSKMQDLLAEATGMERGNLAEDTGRKHRSALEQRITAQEAKIAELEAKTARIGVIDALKVSALGLIEKSPDYQKLQGEKERLTAELEQSREEKETAILERKEALQTIHELEDGNMSFSKEITRLKAENERYKTRYIQEQGKYTDYRTWLDAWEGMRKLARKDRSDESAIGRGIAKLADWLKITFRAAAEFLLLMAGLSPRDEDNIRPQVYEIADRESMRQSRGLMR